MARRYDSRTTIFSPEGRLYQVEYAMEAINHAGTVIGILAQCAPPSEDEKKKDEKDKPKEDVTMTDAPAASTSAAPAASSSSTETEKTPPGIVVDAKTGKKKRMGVVLAAEKKVTSKLLEKEKGASEKIFVVNGNMVSAVAGITADANSLVNYTRNVAQSHLMSYDEDMPVEQLVKRVCDMKQGYTQYGGLRPFGVSFLIAGYDPHHQFQLYSTDPSGNYAAWKATCVGNGNATATSLLRQDYKDEIGVEEAIELACKVLGKTMDSTTLSSEKIEFAVMTLDEETGYPHAHVYKPEEIDVLLKKHGLAKEESADTAMATS